MPLHIRGEPVDNRFRTTHVYICMNSFLVNSGYPPLPNLLLSNCSNLSIPSVLICRHPSSRSILTSDMLMRLISHLTRFM